MIRSVSYTHTITNIMEKGSVIVHKNTVRIVRRIHAKLYFSCLVIHSMVMKDHHQTTILIDMDGVIADQHQGFITVLKDRAPGLLSSWDGQDVHYDFEHHFPAEHQAFVRALREEEGFFRALPLIDGAKEAIAEMKESGHHVVICTAPIWKYQYCIPEKLAWIEHHFGHEQAANTIITRDKTLIHGDFLIDDKEMIDGVQTPSWEHLLFDRPYNKECTQKRHLNWENWESIIE